MRTIRGGDRGLLAVGILSLFAQGCTSAYLRLGVANDRPRVVVAGGERMPNPVEPYPYFWGTAIDAVFVSAPITDALRHDAGNSDLAVGFLVAALGLVDLPLSGLLDTVLLPLDYVAHRRYLKAVAAYSIRMQQMSGTHEGQISIAP